MKETVRSPEWYLEAFEFLAKKNPARYQFRNEDWVEGMRTDIKLWDVKHNKLVGWILRGNTSKGGLALIEVEGEKCG